MTNNTKIEVGDRFEDIDPRQGTRVVRVIALADGDVQYRIEVAEFNPKTVGDENWISVGTLSDYYRKVSR